MPIACGAAMPLRDARHDIDRNPRRAQCVALLAAAAEHERVAALQAHHAPPGTRLAQQQAVNEFLRRRLAAAALADLDHPGAGRGVVEHAAVDEVVDQDHLGLRERAHGFEGQKLRAGADEGDAAAVLVIPSAARDLERDRDTSLRSG